MEAFRLGVGFKEYVDFHKKHLVSKGASDDQIKKQLKAVKNLDRYFEED